MINHELSKIFNEIAAFLDVRRVSFKPFAYRRAARALDGLGEDVAAIYQAGGLKALEEIPGVGESIAQKIEEYIKKGKIGYYDELKRQLPVDLAQITSIQGIGPRRAEFLYRELGIANIVDLESAARSHKIAGLAGFGDQSEKNILQGIDFKKHSQGRFLLGQMLPLAKEIKAKLEALAEIERVDIVGSLARRRETIGDVDFLAIARPEAGKAGVARVMDFFTEIPGVEKIWGKGGTKASVHMEDGFDMDLRVLPPESYGAARQYFTGSKDHNIAVRRLAIDKGLKLSEYGLFRGKKMIAGAQEEEIYNKLGMDWIAPEMRENTGEIEAAQAHRLPKIIEYGSLRGDLHCHTDYSDGQNTLEEMARAALKMGYEYIGISDHTRLLRIARGLSEEQFAKRNREIDKLNILLQKEEGGLKILKGCEANIAIDGSIDLPDSFLAQLDYVIAGVHSNFKAEGGKMTAAVIRAMENPNVDIISHPTGRKLQERAGYRIDMEKIFAAAKRTGTILEINSQPARLDLDCDNIRRVKDYGVKMIINTDAHHADHLRYAEFGIAQARRGWAKASDIINTQPWESVRALLKKQSDS